jgi:CBS domain-containing protein/PII-like signaling protein
VQLQGKAVRVTIYIGESDRHRGGNLYTAILEFLRREGAAGATVTRALAGFGAHSRIHTADIEVLSSDLPIRIEWIDLPERVERLLPQVRRMVNDGLILQDEVTVVQYSMGRSQEPLEQPVRHIMREEVLTVGPATPVAQVVTLLLERGVRCLPVVDGEGRPVGIITDGDLLRRAGLTARLGVHADLPAEVVRADLAALRESTDSAGDIMTRGVITVRDGDTVRTAVARMAKHGLKRLPVVSETGRLVGMVSRIDVFRTVEYHQGAASPVEDAPRTGRTVAELMHADVPTVGPDAALEEIVQALERSQRRRVVVVDGEHRVLGIVTDGDLLRRSRQGRHSGLVERLRALLTGQEAAREVLPDAGECAADLMTTPVIVVRPDTPLDQALGLMTQHGVKRLPVVDAEGRLVGLLGRASVLRGLIERSEIGLKVK